MTSTRRAFVLGALAATTLPAHAGLRLRVTATPSIFKTMFRRLVDEFQKTHPGVSIDLNTSARHQTEQFQSTLRRALIDDLPDVSFEAMSSLRALRARKIALPIDRLIRGDPQWNSAVYDDSLTRISTVDAAVMGLGAAISLPIIYYNADRVEALLGSRPFPREWDHIIALVRRLGARARPGELAGYVQHPLSGPYYKALVQSAGGRMVDEQGRPAIFDGPESRDALEIYRAFALAGQARAVMGNDQVRQAFAGGTIGVLIDSSSSLATLEKQIGSRFRLKTASIPIAPNGRIPVTGVCSVLFAREPLRQQAAWRFMKFVAGPDGQKIIGTLSGYFPANAAVVRRADWMGDYYKSRVLSHALTRSLPFATSLYQFPGRHSEKIDSVISDHVDSVVTLSRTPDEALASMRKSIKALLPAGSA